MKDLFPGQNLDAGPFTIITLAQKTVNDMSKWSSQVGGVGTLRYGTGTPPTYHYLLTLSVHLNLITHLRFSIFKVEEERDEKTEHFIQAAKEICGRSLTKPFLRPVFKF